MTAAPSTLTGGPTSSEPKTDGGYTRSYRRKWDNPIFRTKQEAAIWAWMCDAAQWQDNKIQTKFGPIDLKRGEILIAERVVADDFGLHRNTLRDLMNRMIKDGMISPIQGRCAQRAGTVIRVTKYDEYQGHSGSEARTANGTANCTANGTASGTANNIEFFEQNQGDTIDIGTVRDRKKDRNEDQKRTANGTKNKEVKESKESKDESLSNSETPSDSRDVGASADVARCDPFLPGCPVPVKPSKRQGINRACEIWNSTAAAAGLPAVKMPLAPERKNKLYAALKQMGSTPEECLETWEKCCRLAAKSSYMARDRRGMDFMYRGAHWQQMLEGQFIDDFVDVGSSAPRVPSFGVVNGGRQQRKLPVETILPRRRDANGVVLEGGA